MGKVLCIVCDGEENLLLFLINCSDWDNTEELQNHLEPPLFEGGVNKGEFFPWESSMDLWEGFFFLVFHFQDRNRCRNSPWEGNCVSELQEKNPELSPRAFPGAGKGNFGGLRFQPGQGVLEMLFSLTSSSSCSAEPPGNDPSMGWKGSGGSSASQIPPEVN